ncbi:MAG: amino acid ABC transporter ATP-binding protein, partial [Candidatus Microbacterium stercoravium]
MIIEVNGLRKSFGSNEVLTGIDLEVADGEVVCVVGPSGSGKSTLLRCLNRLEEITGGEVTVDGHTLTDPKVKIDDVRAEIGMVFQQFNLFPHMTVIENICLAPMQVRGLSKEQARERGRALLAKVGLAE